MKNYISNADLAIWIALITGKAILCLCIFWKRLFRRLPWFSTYVLASALESTLLFAIAFLASYATYYYTFYVTSHTVAVLAFLTLIEFGRQVLPGIDLPRKEKAAACLLGSIGAIVVFISVWPFRYVEKRIEVGAYLVIAMAFLVTAVYSRSLGLRWSRLLGGISFPLGLQYLIQGVAKAFIGHANAAFALQIRQLSQIASVLAPVAWIVAVLLPWGEYPMTEEDILNFQHIVGAMEANWRRFVTGGSR